MSKRITNEEFINKCKQIHGDTYNYSYINYQGMRNPITVNCKEHGFWKPLAMNFLKGCGCPICGQNKAHESRKDTTESFIEKAREIHGDKYDYSKVKYINSTTPVEIICPIHGSFFQRPGNHLHLNNNNGAECPKCSRISATNQISSNIEEFIEKARKVHGNKYDYSKSVYFGSRFPITIICPIHGEFRQLASNHLKHRGCPNCIYGKTKSINEKEIINFIKSLIPNIKILENNRNIISKELDIYLPEKQLAFEFDGLYWHSEIYKNKSYHLEKTKECELNNIRLIHIFENEWLYKSEIIKSRIRQLLGIQKFKIPARKCMIKQVSVKDERLFLENNHLQGYIASQVCYGLYFTNPDNNKEYLVSLMSFGKLRKNLGLEVKDGVFELYRFCNLKNFTIQGGASKLFKYFLKQFNPKQIISYADRRWSINNEHNLYHQLGFEFSNNTEINYYYVDGTELINRFSMRKDILISEYNCPQEMTEQEFCEEILGFYRIYDCGNLKYIWQAK